MKPPEFPVEPPSLDASLDAVLDEVQRPPGAFDQLRELPTPARIALGVLVAVVFAGVVIAVLGVRRDLPEPFPARFAAGLVGLGVGAIGAAALALRGPHKAPLGTRGGLVALSLVLASLVTGLFPGFWPGDGGHGMGLGCLAVGTVAAGIGGGALLGLARARALPWDQRALAGVAGGLLGFAMNEVWCAAGDLPHLLIGHCSLALVGAVLISSLGSVIR